MNASGRVSKNRNHALPHVNLIVLYADIVNSTRRINKSQRDFLDTYKHLTNQVKELSVSKKTLNAPAWEGDGFWLCWELREGFTAFEHAYFTALALANKFPGLLRIIVDQCNDCILPAPRRQGQKLALPGQIMGRSLSAFLKREKNKFTRLARQNQVTISKVVQMNLSHQIRASKPANIIISQPLPRCGKKVPFYSQPRVQWFVQRDLATPDMKRELGRFPQISFLGVSHAKLQGYLQETLNENLTKILPWHSIDVYFVCDRIGSLWEDAAFAENAKKHRHLIAAELTSPIWISRLSSDFEVRFHECPMYVGHSGSFFCRQNVRKFDITYVVQSLPVRAGDLPKALTFKMDARDRTCRNKVHQAVWDHYQESYDILRRTSKPIGAFRRSLWDESAADWAAFCGRRNVLESDKYLTSFIKFRQDEKILDLAGGTGHTAKTILDKCPNAHITVLDSSPQMLFHARHVLVGRRNVDYCLCHLPATDGESFDIGDGKFSKIIIHRSLRNLAHDFSALQDIAKWCYDHLELHGQVVIGAHNGSVDIPSALKNWTDPFRTALKLQVTEKKIRTRKAERKIHQKEVNHAFESCGFVQTKIATKYFPLTMEDRLALWKVPAVLDSFLDIHAIGLDQGRRLVEEAMGPVIHRTTTDMRFVFWIFQKQDKGWVRQTAQITYQ